jgi:adenylylsulfate kinase
MEKKGFTVWFTGLPFSGKKKLAGMLAAELESLGYKTEVLDGGKIRREYEEDLGYSKEDVYKNIHRICFECEMLTETDTVAIAITISPFEEMRQECRNKIGRYIEVYCKASLKVLKKRDTKGLYQAAEEGTIHDVAGITIPYEEPKRPEVIFRSDKDSYEKGLAIIIKTLTMLGFIEKPTKKILSDEEEDLIRKHLKDMGYI